MCPRLHQKKIQFWSQNKSPKNTNNPVPQVMHTAGITPGCELSEPWNRQRCKDRGYRADTHRCPVAEGTSWTRPPLQVTRGSTLSLILKISQALLRNPGLLVPLKPNIIFILFYQELIGSFFCFISWETILPEAATRVLVPAKKERQWVSCRDTVLII